MLKDFNLEGKVALVTGAGRGIGTGIAEVLSEAGATIVLNALTERYLVPFAEGLAQRTGRTVHAIAGDITTPEGASRLVAEAERRAGPLDILVNNLGDAIRGPLVDLPGKPGISDADVRTVMDLNLMSAIWCARAAGAGMMVRRRGRVLNISSFAGERGRAELSIYSAGKAGLHGLTRALAREWASFGVTVNAIAPGVFPDPVTFGTDGVEKMRRDIAPHVPLGRLGEMREVGLLALYLVSDAGRYMTGQVLALDGGMTV